MDDVHINSFRQSNFIRISSVPQQKACPLPPFPNDHAAQTPQPKPNPECGNYVDFLIFGVVSCGI